jgi:hypothetical protein
MLISFAGRFLQADPEELSHSRRQIEGGNIAGHVEQISAEQGQDVTDDAHGQEPLGRNSEYRAQCDLGRKDKSDPDALEASHSSLGRNKPQ